MSSSGPARALDGYGTYLADRNTSPGHRGFLIGVSTHQNIPIGGCKMNTAVGDSFDIGRKVAAVLRATENLDCISHTKTSAGPSQSGMLTERVSILWCTATSA